MEIFHSKAQTAAQCWGVKRARNRARIFNQRLKREGNRNELVALGEVVHNTRSVDSIMAEGIGTINHVEEADGKNVITSAHGIDPRLMDVLRMVAYDIEDTTCPIVIAQHEAAVKLQIEQGRKMILIGKRPNHPEILGTIGVLNDKVILIRDETQIRQITYKVDDPIGVIAQTTLDPRKVATILTMIERVFGDVVYLPTTCDDITFKIQEIRDLAPLFDLVIVVSGPKSENGGTLRETVVEMGKPCVFILDPEELRIKSVKDSRRILVTGSASTMIEDVNEVGCKLTDWGWPEKKSQFNPQLSAEYRYRISARQAGRLV